MKRQHFLLHEAVLRVSDIPLIFLKIINTKYKTI